jgi:hypothetical protein
MLIVAYVSERFLEGKERRAPWLQHLVLELQGRVLALVFRGARKQLPCVAMSKSKCLGL